MDNEVEFVEEENIILPQMQKKPVGGDMPGLGKILAKTGLIKNRTQANIALTIIALCAFGLSIYVFINFVF